MWWPSGWPLIPSRLFSHLHLLVAAQAGLKFVCVFGHDGDVQLCGEIRRVRQENFDVYGVHKVWRQLRREGRDVVLCQNSALLK